MQKLAYLDVIPYLFARLDTPGVRDRCIAQWNAAPQEHHHEESRLWMDEASPLGLRPLVDAVDDHGGNVDPVLQEEVDSLCNIPMDDCTAEGPHARSKRLWCHCPTQTFAWHASSARLQQNLSDLRQLPQSVGRDLQTEWDRASSVLQMVNMHRPVRLPRKEVQRHVYCMGHCGAGGMVVDRDEDQE